MSTIEVEVAKFYREIAQTKTIWSIKDEVGFPAPIGGKGKRAMPFWSSKVRAEEEIANVPSFKGFEPVAIAWDVFTQQMLPGMERDGLLAGVNWSSIAAVSLDVTPTELQQQVEIQPNN
ncbi:DUF2750 domain-containing protein [Chitinibacter bivalviorum]|uniref:DUF2750 domain-containing protein n=1 Tax=Chitinibacter bivalviorum TaxID=2739434 RepID=A0A7H9BLS2_9NEIS|nr:DUF2750 domain-containing protein [Chitinibacter bivalviorum]QLG89399.1 DUF2750 domain-containing protein [Chitinibacter bivalviorum]